MDKQVGVEGRAPFKSQRDTFCSYQLLHWSGFYSHCRFFYSFPLEADRSQASAVEFVSTEHTSMDARSFEPHTDDSLIEVKVSLL